MSRGITALVGLSLAVGCGQDRCGTAHAPTASTSWHVKLASSSSVRGDQTKVCPVASRPASRRAPARLVAVGDVHGDLGATRRALRLAGAIDQRDRWIGGAMGVIQLGDVLDRGDDEQAIIDLFERLEREASAAGGSFQWLLGNHELMNAAGDFRYVTEGGWRDFADAPGVSDSLTRLQLVSTAEDIPAEARPRLAAMLPGGVYARIFAGQDVAVRIGDTVFSHAGLARGWTAGLEAMNHGADCWLAGAGSEPAVLAAVDGPVWTREWGEAQVDCDALGLVLAAAGARRMVVAHTPQQGGITSVCQGRLWRVDTGMSAHYGGPIQVLELSDTSARVLSE